MVIKNPGSSVVLGFLNKEKSNMKTIKTLLLTMFICISWIAKAQEKSTFSNQVQLMDKEQDPEKNVAALSSIVKTFKLDTIKNTEEIDVLKGQVALSYLRVSNHPEFERFIHLIKNKFNQTSFLNMASEILRKDKSNMDYAEVLAKWTVDLYESYKDDPLARPATFLLEDWNRFMSMAAYPYYEAYAEILHTGGKDKLALFYEEKALKDKNMEDIMQSSIELYTELLALQGQEEKAYQMLLKNASVGKSSFGMKALLKSLTLKKMGSVKAFNFLDSLERNASDRYKKELLTQMILNTDAPDFTMVDLEKKKVSLNQLKGKVVVLDFWATWCAPCIASMPAMQRISGLHPEVVFLFVVTREQGQNAALRVKSYIKKSGFPLNTLMDLASVQHPERFPVSDSYKITGIPTKVVIDGKGKMRFLTKGFKNDTELINELEAMISIAKAQ